MCNFCINNYYPVMNSSATQISPTELYAKIQARSPFKLVEALPAKYYQEAHLPTALNLPLDQIDELAANLLPNKEELIVTYCASAACENSATAAAHLRKLGYVNVREYAEGKAGWIAAGLPVDTVVGKAEVSA
jgi:rhodanese-related sulfurtransferase